MKLYELAIGLEINKKKLKPITESKDSKDKKKSELGSKQKRS
jgi:hypothetical protein